MVAEKFQKKVQNETTKLFSVGNTFFQATMHACIFYICYAMAWIRPMVKSRPNVIKTGNNNVISDGVVIISLSLERF